VLVLSATLVNALIESQLTNDNAGIIKEVNDIIVPAIFSARILSDRVYQFKRKHSIKDYIVTAWGMGNKNFSQIMVFLCEIFKLRKGEYLWNSNYPKKCRC
jgi:hypothetical protein